MVTKIKLFKAIPILIIGLVILSYRLLANNSINTFEYYIILALSGIALVLIFINTKYTRSTKKNKLILLSIGILASLLMTFIFW